MAVIFDICLFCFVITLYFTGISSDIYQLNNQSIQYCSFFNNRAPSAQPGLKNCTWFKDNSCCMQQEISATFGKVKPLKGASLECQRYINYLMCYICAPYQNVYYQGGNLTVCEFFCNSLFDNCKTAILKGSVISELYKNGTKFCESRGFKVSKVNQFCFDFDATRDKRGAAQTLTSNATLMLFTVGITLYLYAFLNHETYITREMKKNPTR